MIKQMHYCERCDAKMLEGFRVCLVCGFRHMQEPPTISKKEGRK